MWTCVFALWTLSVLQNPAAQTGTIAGKLTPPDGPISRPAQVILLSGEFLEMFNTDVLERLDNYWERYKPTFIQQKELFLVVQKMAYRDAFQRAVTLMRQDNRTRSANFLGDSTADGKFEFKNVPVGRYKILALGRAGNEEVVWQDSVDLTSSLPLYVQLKKTIP